MNRFHFLKVSWREETNVLFLEAKSIKDLAAHETNALCIHSLLSCMHQCNTHHLSAHCCLIQKVEE